MLTSSLMIIALEWALLSTKSNRLLFYCLCLFGFIAFMIEYPINEIDPLTEIRLLRIPTQSYEKMVNGEFFTKLVNGRIIIYDSQKNEVGFVDIGNMKSSPAGSTNELVCEFTENGLDNKYSIIGECIMHVAENGSLSKKYVEKSSRSSEKKISQLKQTNYTPQRASALLDQMQTRFEESHRKTIGYLDELQQMVLSGEIPNKDSDYLRNMVSKIKEKKTEMINEENRASDLAQNYARQIKK